MMPKKKKAKAPEPVTVSRCPSCDQPRGDEVECPSCHQLKLTCCGIAGRNVRCFECEES